MVCTNPIILGDDAHAAFPCGHCISCRIQRSQEWAIRLTHESLYWDSILFATYTYDPDHLPPGGSLDKKRFMAAMKTLRERFRRKGRTFRYYAVGEYGDLYGRPHVHAILYGVNVDDFKPLPAIYGKFTADYWPEGFVDLKPFASGRALYIAGYIQKKQFGKGAAEAYGAREAPWLLPSKRLGRQWALDHRKQIEADECIYFKGRRHGVPRYYCKVLDLQLSAVDLDYKQRQEAENLRRIENWKIKDEDLDLYYHAMNKQRRRNKERKVNQKKLQPFATSPRIA